MTPLSLEEQHQDRARRGTGRTGLGTSWGSGHFLLHVTDLGGAALGYGSQRSKRCQEVLLICTDPLCLLLPHTEQGAAEELHGPCLDSPSTDSYSDHSQGHIPLPAQRPSMEVTTLSPSPISPTEGDDLCEIDVTSVAIHSVALLLSVCGLAGNGAVFWLLRLERHNARIFALAVTDFLFLLLTFPSVLVFLVEDVSCSPIMPLGYLSFLFQLSVVSNYWGLSRLMRIGMKSAMDKLWLLCCHHYIPMRLFWAVDSVQYWAFFTAITVIPSVTSLCTSHQQEQCQTALISIFIIILLFCAAPVIVASTVNSIKANCWSQQQQPKRRDIVILLLVLFTLLLSLCNFLQQLGYILVSSQVFFLLACIHSSIKPFIYFLAGQCWRPCSVKSLRESLRRVFDEPEKKTPRRKVAAMDTGV